MLLTLLISCAEPAVELAESDSSSPTVDSEAPTDSVDTGFGEMSFARVQVEVFEDKCVGCHYTPAQSRYGSLALDRNTHETLTTEDSNYGEPYVVPGSLDGSFLWKKLNDLQSNSQGGDMPPYDTLNAEQIWLVETWITEGASAD